MAKTKAKQADPDATPEQREMAKIRAIPRGERTEEQKARLKELMEAEGRRRFRTLVPKRLERVKKALAALAACGNRASYTYTSTQAAGLIGEVDGSVKALVQAFAEPSNGKPTTRTYSWMD